MSHAQVALGIICLIALILYIVALALNRKHYKRKND